MATVHRKIRHSPKDLIYDWQKPVQARARELPRAVLSQELQDAADEAGEWAANRHDRAAEMMWREHSGRGALPQCRGESCAQGHKPCRERCGAEMAVASGNDPPGFWRSLWLFLTGK